MKQTIHTVFVYTLCFCVLCCCRSNNRTYDNQVDKVVPYKVSSPSFCADSAYQYILQQVSLGPRVPQSEAHRICGDFLVAKLREFGAEVHEQHASAQVYNGAVLPLRNIIGRFFPEKKNRILLCAHWDTRPFADQELDPANHHTPILGANDGASGVGVLLEIARMLQQNPTEVGIDIIFFDLEDYGEPTFDSHTYTNQNWWCLGSQYWAKNPYPSNYSAQFGILLDMVAAPNAKFFKEIFSRKYAPKIQDKVWKTARNLGYGKFFIDEPGGAITDDHLPVNEIKGIPCINIIQFDPNTPQGFGEYWHTRQDNMDNISKKTLLAVGQTVAEVIYSE